MRNSNHGFSLSGGNRLQGWDNSGWAVDRTDIGGTVVGQWWDSEYYHEHGAEVLPIHRAMLCVDQ